MMVGHMEKNKASKGIISPSHFFILVLKKVITWEWESGSA